MGYRLKHYSRIELLEKIKAILMKLPALFRIILTFNFAMYSTFLCAGKFSLEYCISLSSHLSLSFITEINMLIAYQSVVLKYISHNQTFALVGKTNKRMQSFDK